MDFEGTEAAEPILKALNYLKSIDWKGRKGRKSLDDAPISAISRGWQRLAVTAVNDNGKVESVDRKTFALGVLEALQYALKRRDVYVSLSERYADPRANLLSGEEWEAARPGVLRALELPADPEEYLGELGESLDTAYRRTAENLPDNADVSVGSVGPKAGGKDALDISRLDELEEPDSLFQPRRGERPPCSGTIQECVRRVCGRGLQRRP